MIKRRRSISSETFWNFVFSFPLVNFTEFCCFFFFFKAQVFLVGQAALDTLFFCCCFCFCFVQLQFLMRLSRRNENKKMIFFLLLYVSTFPSTFDYSNFKYNFNSVLNRF